MRIFLFLLPAITAWAAPTMLSQAENISKMYAQEIAKAAPPSQFPLSENCLGVASVWFSVDLNQIAASGKESALGVFTSDEVWQLLKEIGVEGVAFEHLRGAGTLGLDPKWRQDWTALSRAAQKRNIALIGNLIGNATAPGSDFQQALQNVGEYPNLYHLIEVDPKDWKMLPKVLPGTVESNVPWLTVQELHKRGYVPEDFTPYIKESAWNATAKVQCADGKVRRWIYLKEGKNNPVLAWLNPTFAAYRLAAGDAIEGAYQLGQRIFRVDGKIPQIAQEMLALWVRKIGGYTAELAGAFIEDLAHAPTDLAYDIATRPALLHAILTEDARALQMIYRLYFEEGIAAKRLVHALESFDSYVCDWVQLMNAPKKKFLYWEELVTGEVLRQRLLKEDMIRLETPEAIPRTTWVDYCARSLGIKDFEKHKNELARAHLLLAFTYAMQPGAFSFSIADLLGALPEQTTSLELMGPNNGTLYSSLPVQLTNPRSFASQLKAILTARRETNIATGELIAIPSTPHPGTLLLLHRLPSSRFIYLLAVNFSRKPVEEMIEMAEIRNTWPIDAMTNLAEEKVFSSGSFSFMLPPLSGRAFYFQPKYYD